MPSYIPPKKNTAFVFYLSLVSQADTKLFQSNPTLAAGDVKVSIDGGALANLATLPTVTPASSKMLKVSLSAAEMNGDNITVIFADAAGVEWADVTVSIPTSAKQIDSLEGVMTRSTGALFGTDESIGIEVAVNTESVGSVVDLFGSDVAEGNISLFAVFQVTPSSPGFVQVLVERVRTGTSAYVDAHLVFNLESTLVGNRIFLGKVPASRYMKVVVRNKLDSGAITLAILYELEKS